MRFLSSILILISVEIVLPAAGEFLESESRYIVFDSKANVFGILDIYNQLSRSKDIFFFFL